MGQIYVASGFETATADNTGKKPYPAGLDNLYVSPEEVGKIS